MNYNLTSSCLFFENYLFKTNWSAFPCQIFRNYSEQLPLIPQSVTRACNTSSSGPLSISLWMHTEDIM